MVKILSSQDQHIIHQATLEAEKHTTAEIETVIVSASDSYANYMMFFGFIIASLLNLFLWYKKIIIVFPLLLTIQVLFAVVFPHIPGMRTLILKLLPKKIYQHRAALLAAEKRLAASNKFKPTTPVLLIFISLAERYIHVFPNSIIREKIPHKEWENVVRKLAQSIPSMKIAKATAQAILASSQTLMKHFPE